jgi:RHS repeat-associated protein
MYFRGSQGNQDVEYDGSGNWIHDNIFADGVLTATYWNNTAQGGTPTNPVPSLSYDFVDWVGTKRVQMNGSAQVEAYWTSDPFGNYLTPYGSGLDATEHHFTSQERDWETGNGPTSSGVQETGNDYFGARYYASTMGRFMSPDPSQLDYADQTNPQSLNLYSYVRNNPLINTDPSGMECVWDDGSYDSNNDPDTGNGGGLTGVGTRDYAPGQGPGQQRCSAAGGTWVDHSFFAPLGLPDWLSADNAPDSGGTDQIALYLAGLVKGCTDKILGDISAEFGSGLTTSDVTGNFLNGGAVNINLHATNLPAALYSSIHAGRQPSFIGPSLHLPDGPTKPGGLDPYALKFSKQPADKSVVTTAHIDSAYASAFNPVGAAIHGIVDVAGHDTRNPCP